MRNVHQIHQWAASDRASEFLRKEFGISHVPCYYWILCLLKLIKPESLNRCFVEWVYSLMPEKLRDMTISLDGKTICSTVKMEKIENPLRIISAQVCELGLTLAQRCTDDKSNEIPAVQELLKELNIRGNMVVQDASLRGEMRSASKREKNHGRIETRTAFVTEDVQWLEQKKEWKTSTA